MVSDGAALPRIGQILSGKYELVRLLGEGGMASVFEATHLRLKQRVAIKVLAPDMSRDPELVARFEHEARAVAKLKTPHVARVMDVDTSDDGLPFIVMEFLEGRDLEGELTARQRLPVDEAADYILQACAAMIEAHENGIVHRDLKPANLFLLREGQDRTVKVLDFGISKVIGEATRLTGAGAVMGTVLYMSPEQIRASKDVDQRADIWSLGVILFELVAGRPPWEGNSHQVAAAIMGNVPPDIRTFAPVPEPLANVITSMLQRDARRRMSTVTEVILALAPYARPDSIGGVIASQVALGATGPRMRAIAARDGRQMKSVTVPMISNAPKPPPQAPPPAVPMRPRSPSLPSTSTPTPAPSHDAPKKPRNLVALGVFVGFVGAVGVTLTVTALWYAKRPQPVPAVDRPRPVTSLDRVPSASSTPPASAPPASAPPAPTAPDTAAPDTAAPRPPPTGTATSPPTSHRPGQGAKPGATAPRSSSPTTTAPPPASATENPSLL